jgi:hypothetical protein
VQNRHLNNAVDEASRILAGTLPRRQALKALTRVLAGSIFAAFGGQQSFGQQPCQPACKGGQVCCPGAGGRGPFCIGRNQTCCGSEGCAPTQTCCTGGNGQNFCSSRGGTCCGNTSCGRTHTCCGNRVCCDQNQTCCGNIVCCGQHQTCRRGRCDVSKS